MTVAVGLRLVTATRGGAVLARRPRSRVVHVVHGPTTRTGLHVRAGARPVCGARTRRLTVVAGVTTVPVCGWRFCRTCTRLLGPTPDQVFTRDQVARMFANVTVDDLTVAAGWCLTVDETHEVSRVASIVHGTPPVRRPTTTGRALELWVLEQTLLDRRRRLRLTEMSPEEHAAVLDQREGRRAHADAMAASYRHEHAVARAQDRARRGQYLLPHQRDLIHRAETRRP